MALQKLKQKKGETLVEVLFSILIGLLAITMLVMMLTTSIRIIRQGQDAMGGYYTNNNILTAKNTETSTGTITFEETTNSENKKTYIEEVYFYENQSASEVISYKGK